MISHEPTQVFDLRKKPFLPFFKYFFKITKTFDGFLVIRDLFGFLALQNALKILFSTCSNLSIFFA